MEKLKTSLTLLLLLTLSTINGQVSGNTSTSNETIYVHHSGSLFFTGEYLFYKVYCMETEGKKLSRLSKVAYVELIGQEQDLVFRHKIPLDKGIGQSDFFIPNSIPSGNYKLVAYTQWMKNRGVEHFFQSDISIVNPYRGNQSSILNTLSEENGSTTTKTSEKIIPIIYTGDANFKEFKLELNKRSFKRRESVSLSFKNFIRQKGFGNYSISVKKIDELPVVSNHTAMSYHQLVWHESKGAKKNSGQLMYVPESSGAIISGKVIDKRTGQMVKGQDVALSISGDDFFFKVATTNDLGAFQFSLDPYYAKETALFQLIDGDRESFRIEIDEHPSLDYAKLSFASFTISASMEEAIKRRSIYNQIENGYFSIKPDTVRPLPLEKPFTAYEKMTRYDLDDYTRFSTMEEVFTEIVKAVWTVNDANGNRVVKVFNNKFSAPTEDLPLLFIDGTFIANHEDFLSFNAAKVQKISMLRNKYRFGSKDYQGVILVETILGDYRNSSSQDYAKEVPLFLSQRKKRYYFQNYKDASDFARIPDFRSQLLWEPSVVLTSSEMSFTFFTSDNVGQYEISLEGFTSEGIPVSLRETISVEE